MTTRSFVILTSHDGLSGFHHCLSSLRDSPQTYRLVAPNFGLKQRHLSTGSSIYTASHKHDIEKENLSFTPTKGVKIASEPLPDALTSVKSVTTSNIEEDEHWRPKSLPPAENEEEFIQRLKKAIRSARRNDETIRVKFDPSEEKQRRDAEELKKKRDIEKLKSKVKARKEAGEEVEEWRLHKIRMKEKFPEGWQPRKKLSPDAMDAIRTLHNQFPEQFTTSHLSEMFEVSPEAVRRILKSRWREKQMDIDTARRLAERWNERGKRVWTQGAAFGKNPPTKWEKQGIHRDRLQIGQRDGQEGNRAGVRIQRKWAKKKKDEMMQKYKAYKNENRELKRTVRVRETSTRLEWPTKTDTSGDQSWL